MHSWGCATWEGVHANASNYTNKKCYCKETERKFPEQLVGGSEVDAQAVAGIEVYDLRYMI